MLERPASRRSQQRSPQHCSVRRVRAIARLEPSPRSSPVVADIIGADAQGSGSG